ncbi:MAG: hypothetical protein KDA93_16740 [Planctomycetaceae bacterium]|nr:hypothetical protein [Planctomycetaceae bacterium]
MAEWLEMVREFAGSNGRLLWIGGISSGVMFLGTLIVVPLLLTWMPADYFLKDPQQREEDRVGRHPVVRITVRVLKNLVGAVFVVCGIAMLVLPGQGILTILLGVVLLDFPGKRRLEVALLRVKSVHRAVDWLRRKGNREPLELPSP